MTRGGINRAAAFMQVKLFFQKVGEGSGNEVVWWESFSTDAYMTLQGL